MCYTPAAEVDWLYCPSCGASVQLVDLFNKHPHDGELHVCGEPEAMCWDCEIAWETQFDDWGHSEDGDWLYGLSLTGEKVEPPSRPQLHRGYPQNRLSVTDLAKALFSLPRGDYRLVVADELAVTGVELDDGTVTLYVG